MTLEEYNELKKIAYYAASRRAIRLTPEQLHDVATAIWEGERVFLSRNPKATPEHLRNFRFLKASGAAVEQMWFSTWATKGKAPMRLNSIEALAHHVISNDEFKTIEQAQQLHLSKNGNIVIEYVLGSTMKEIGNRLGITESAVSQKLKEFKLQEA